MKTEIQTNIYNNDISIVGDGCDAELSIINNVPKVTIEVGSGGIPGAPGANGSDGADGADGTGDANYTHTEVVAKTLWTISHGLSKFPSVSTEDSAGTRIVGDVDYIDSNNLTITFYWATDGVAYLN